MSNTPRSCPTVLVLALVLMVGGPSATTAAALFTCTDGFHATTSSLFATDLAPPDAHVATSCEPLASSHTQTSGGTGASSASVGVHTLVGNGVVAQALATTVQSHATASASGIARLVFRVHSDTLTAGTTIPLAYSVELLTLDHQVAVSDQGSASFLGRGFFGMGVYDPVQETWATVGPTGGPLLPLTATLGIGATVGRMDQPLYVQVGGTFFLYLQASARVTVNGIGGGTSLNSAAGLLAVQMTGALTAPGNAEIEWLAHDALGLPLPRLGDIGFTPVPLPAPAWLLAGGVIGLASTSKGRARRKLGQSLAAL